MANMIYTLFLIPAGFIANLDTLFVGLAWVSEISFIRRSMEAILTLEFTGMNFTCPAYETCNITTGQEALDSFSMGNVNTNVSIGVLLALIGTCMIVALLGMRFANQKPSN